MFRKSALCALAAAMVSLSAMAQTIPLAGDEVVPFIPPSGRHSALISDIWNYILGKSAQTPDTVRGAINVDPFVSALDPIANGGSIPFGDLQEFDAQVCYNSGGAQCGAQDANILDFTTGSGTTSTAVTAPLGGQTLTLGSNAWCTQRMGGQPLYIAGVTAPGTRLTGCLTANRISVDAPVISAATGNTMTIQYGVNFQKNCPSNPAASGVTGCVGSTIITPFWAGVTQATGVAMTITKVNTPTNITVSVAGVSSVINNITAHFMVGHDDSIGVSNACAYASANQLTLVVPLPMLVPAMDKKCLGIYLRGVGRLATAGTSLAPGAGLSYEPVVVPPWAGPPPPPKQSLIAKRDLPNLAAAGVAPNIALTYDSLAQDAPDNINISGSYPSLFKREFVRQNGFVHPAVTSCGVGGAKIADLDGLPLVTDNPCIPSTVTAFLAQIASNVAPAYMDIGGGNNDGTSFSVSALADVFVKSTTSIALGGVFTAPVDLSVTTHHPYSRIQPNAAGTLPVEGSMDFANGYLSSFGSVMHIPVFDGAAEGEKHLYGYDPTALKLERSYDVAYGANAIALPFIYPQRARGFALDITKSGVFGNTFWPSFTGNAGVTDSRGPFIAFQVGYDQGQANYVWLFQRAGNTIGIQCDPTNLLPGLGCDDPATGAPPVKPSRMGNITVSAANPGVITTTTGFAWPCTVGMTVAVPGAGASQTVPGFGSYVEPWITVVTVCTSNTSITGTGAAPTSGTFNNSFVMSGNPIIANALTDVGDGAGNEGLHVEVKGDDLVVWLNTKFFPIYVGKIMRPRTPFTAKIFSGGNRPTFNVAADGATGKMTTWQTARPVPNFTDVVDADVSGPADNAPPSNASYIGPSGGDGNNHNTSIFGERVISPMYQASDFVIPSASGVATVVPTVGQTVTVAGGTGTYLVNPAGTLASLTVNLPNGSFYRIGDILTLSFNQVITSLTISPGTAPSQTVNGAAVTAASLGQSFSYKYVASNVWQRMQ